MTECLLTEENAIFIFLTSTVIIVASLVLVIWLIGLVLRKLHLVAYNNVDWYYNAYPKLSSRSTKTLEVFGIILAICLGLFILFMYGKGVYNFVICLLEA